MDKEEVVFPGDFIKAAAEKRLLGLRFPSEFGGRKGLWVNKENFKSPKFFTG